MALLLLLPIYGVRICNVYMKRATRMRVLGETKLGRKEIDYFLNAVLPAAAAVARRTDGAEKSSFVL